MIFVTVEPKIIQPPMSNRVTENEDVTFECKIMATAYPITKINWTYEENSLNVSISLCIK